MMRNSCRLILVLWVPLVFAQPWQGQSQFNILMNQIEEKYQSGDHYLQSDQIDSALSEYLQARKLVNELFFLLVEAKKGDTLSNEMLTQKWDSISTKMRIKLPDLDDCQFDRCYIYPEEQAANRCLTILTQGKPEASKLLTQKLIVLLEQDTRSQLKNFFGKIYYYLKLQNSLANFQNIVLAPEQEQAVNEPNEMYSAFIEAYQQYQIQQTR